MRLRLEELAVACQRSQEMIRFRRFNYFHGKMGAGKSSIARLIDYCLGGDLDLTPALQSEFVTATLSTTVGGSPLVVERQRQSSQVHAQWRKGQENFDAVIPAWKPAGEVVPQTGIEVLSDLFYHLVGVQPPLVRRSKLRDDSELGRLSVRDLLWYCYLDQDGMDSTFFHLDAEADQWKRLKSRDVLRFLIGFHQERVAELETQLEQVRTERARLAAGANALREALVAANVSSETDIDVRLREIELLLAGTDEQIQTARAELQSLRSHAVDDLRQKGRQLASEVEALEDSARALGTVLSEDRRHLNEILTLSTKFRRMLSARAVLNGVEFEACPRCTQPLPPRDGVTCRVCGQPDNSATTEEAEVQATDKDIDARSKELREAIGQHERQLAMLERRRAELAGLKRTVDAELNAATQQYDSAYLSRALSLEHTKARLEEEVVQLERLRVLPRKVEEQLRRAEALASNEANIRRLLREAREAAERDTANLHLLQELFLDCLVRAKIPGFEADDRVAIRSPWFLPEVTRPGEEEMIVTSFANLGSGGKKTLFKCCFALAVHRLAVKTEALLPTLLIIDSPMKNISERENREQFEGFHRLLYELATTELSDTQFILIDKEFCPPPKGLELDLFTRHMTPDDPTDGPLISTYRGH